MKTSLVSILSAVGLVASLSVANAASVDGKNMAAVSNGFLFVTGGFVDLPRMTATIAKGKPNRVLVVEATLRQLAAFSPGGSLRIYPMVNGSAFEPAPDDVSQSAISKDCEDTVGNDFPFCHMTGSWWIDLDAMEEEAPGTVIGQPLVIQLYVASDVNIGTALTMTARMERK